jgi:hypothetical protein
MSYNTKLIRKVLKRIEKDQRRWNQSTWAGVTNEEKEEDFKKKAPLLQDGPYGPAYLINDALVPDGICGTSFCFAGHTVLAAGDTIFIDPEDLTYSDVCRDKDGNVWNIERRARDLLGITGRESDALFSGEAGGGNWEAYKGIVERVTGVTLK